MFGKLLEPGATMAEAHEIPITKEDFLIGRGDDCDLRLRQSAVSRHHCLLRFQGNTATISDLGSANGTFLNDQRILSQAEIKSGDRLRVGDKTFFVEVGAQSGAAWGSAEADSVAATVKIPKKEVEDKPGHPFGASGSS